MKTLDIYDRIDMKLKEKGTTRKQMCLDLDIPYSTLTSFYQKHSGNITLPTMQKIAAYLGCSMDYLVNGEGNKAYNNNIMYNGNIHSITISNGDESSKRELTEIEYEITKVCSRLSTKSKNELLSYSYQLEARENKND